MQFLPIVNLLNESIVLFYQPIFGVWICFFKKNYLRGSITLSWLFLEFVWHLLLLAYNIAMWWHNKKNMWQGCTEVKQKKN